MASRYEWVAVLYGVENCYVGDRYIGLVATYSNGLWYAEDGTGKRIAESVTLAPACRAVESAFEAWMDRSGLVWKDSLTEEKD